MVHDVASHLRALAKRLNTFLLGIPVFAKVMGIAVGLAVLLGASMLWLVHQTWHAHLLNNLQQRSISFTEHVAGHMLDHGPHPKPEDTRVRLAQSLDDFPDAIYLRLEGPGGEIIVEENAKGASPPPARVRHYSASVGNTNRRLRAGISTARVDREVGWLTRQVARATGVVAILGMAAAWWLTRIFSHPLEEVASLARTVKDGNYETKAPVRSHDEVGELAAAFNEMTDALAQKEAARQHLLRKVIAAGEEERKRIARELHDQTGQLLTSQIAGLSALEAQAQDEKTRHRLEELRHNTEQTLNEVHDLSVALRPSVLDDVGLGAALERHCRTFGARFGIKVEWMETGLEGRRLPSEVEVTTYRVVQEILTNAVRHGRASRIKVLVQRSAAQLLAAVQDNGVGFDSRDWQQHCIKGNHLGLLGIEERVTLLGGVFCVDSQPSKGVRAYAQIPLKAES